MEKKSLGIFLAVLGVIFLGISGITIWSMFFDYDVSKGLLIILVNIINRWHNSSNLFYLCYGRCST